ncbi:phosphatase [Actinomadura logoneensis]|uniref:Phosphatase n=1 Tax=Actinomadura logoneensis TaxID=2293572 RepID=A0A372JQL8_9ACTN|nr:phosphatase [Actinomadura logoneensis]RFU42064.1 phosphatase [Actinomadura logoneensis]
MADAPTRAELRAHLVTTMIAGEVATPRQNNLLHYRRMAARNPYYLFGLRLSGRWDERDVLAAMVERCGVDPDPGHLYGDDTIDPDLTLDALEAMGDRIGLAARRRETLLLATGHPGNLTPLYQAVSEALTDRGCRVLTPASGWTYEIERYGERQTRRVVHTPEGVAMLVDDAGRPQHTHDAAPMETMLAELRGGPRDTATEPSTIASDGFAEAKPAYWPDLAIADHGWAGAAGEAGVDTVGFADCNDPALFAGAAEGKIQVVVPLDDGLSPHHYAPMTAFLLARAGLA